MIICKKCGHHNSDQETFCASCSAFLEWSGERVAEKSVAAQPEQEQEPSEARRPEAAPPDVPRPRPATRVTPPPPEPESSDQECTQCGAGNAASRHFCRRCGAPLGQVTAVRVPWYRRLFRRRQAPAAGDRRGRAREAGPGAGIRTFVLTLLVVIVAGGVLAYAIAPDVRQGVNARADRLVTTVRLQLRPSFLEVHPTGAQASSELTGHPAVFAVDLVSNDYWAADVARDPQPTLVVTFKSPTDLDSLLITSGGSGADYARLARPRTLQITYSDGTGETVGLQDVRAATSYTIHARQVTSATIRITDVYPGTGSTAVAVSELEFFHLK